MERSIELLKACVLLLQKQEESGYVLNLLAETIFYDDCECDGYCLLEDIKSELELLESEEKSCNQYAILSNVSIMKMDFVKKEKVYLKDLFCIDSRFENEKEEVE